jgi:2-deoxy-D-gluconate 3-dehydrogenase
VSLFDLTGRTALVTGAAGGIGQAVAVGLAEAGCSHLVLCDRAWTGGTAALAERHGATVTSLELDVTRDEDVDRTVGSLLRERDVDVLVNAAGQIRRAPAEEHDDATWRSVLEVNLTSVFRLCRLVGGGMLERGRGKVVNIASMLSFQGGHHVASYTASKHGVVGVTKALAAEWASRNVQVNALAPGYIETDVTAALRADPVRSAEILGRIPAGRWGTPDDLTGAAVFLASPASDYVTGHVLAVDGGWLVR